MSDDIYVYAKSNDAIPSKVEQVEMYVLPYDLAANTGRSPAIELIRSLPSLQVVQTLTSGYDHLLDIIPATATLCNGRGLHEASASEHALGLILAAQRELPRWIRDQDRARWAPEYTGSLAGTSVLIIGYGAIGSALACRLQACEVNVLKVARHPRPSDDVVGLSGLDSLLPKADIAVLVVPLDETTYHLLDSERLALLSDNALVVNVSRGPVLDSMAALRELDRLRFALDVTDPEPLPPDHPFWRSERVLITPHIGGGSATFHSRARKLVDDQVRRYREGQELLNVVASAVRGGDTVLSEP